MKKCVAILGMLAVLSIVGLTQAATINFFWWTDVAGGNVDAGGNTWNVYNANGNPNPQLGSGAWDKWTPMSYSGGLWGSVDRPGYDSNKTFTANGYYFAPGVTIQAGQSGTYSWQGSAAASEFSSATLTFGKIVNGTWSSLAEITIPVYTSLDLSTIGALQNISLSVGDTLTLYIRCPGAWVDCNMAAATINFAPPTLTVTPENRSVDSMAGTTSFNVMVVGGQVPWTAQVITGGDWLTITGGASGNSSGTITASYTDNTTSIQRTAIIRATISAPGSTPKDITVTQVKSGVRILPWHWWTDAAGSELDAAGNTWYVFIDKGSRTPGNFMNEWEQLEYFTADNAWKYSIEHTVMKYSNGLLGNEGSWWATAFAILVPQDARYSFSGKIFDSVWSSPTVAVSIANSDGTINRLVADFTADPTTDWSSISSLNNIPVTAGQFILIGTGSAGGGSWVQVNMSEISITTDATVSPILSVTPETLKVDSIAGSTTLTVNNTGTGSMPWTAQVISGGNWFSINNGASGTDTGTITANFTANTAATERTATIRVTANGAAGSPKDITVTQVKSGVRLVTWHWWTNTAGSEVDAVGNTWTVYLDRNLTSPDNFKAAGNDGWSQLKFNPDYGNTGAWFRYEEDENGNENAVLVHPDMKYIGGRVDNEGNWWAIGFTIQAARDGLYSFSGKVPNFAYGNSPTITISVANADGTRNREVGSFTADPTYDWSSNTALQSIEVKTGQYIVIGTGSSAGGGWVQASMSDIQMFVTNRIPGDANGDNKVDVSDLGILAANYGGTGKTWALGDFSGDGKVDVSDLGILAAHYGQGSGNATRAADLPQDMKALGLSFDSNTSETVDTQKTQTQENPVAQSLGGCGSAGLPLIAGLLLMSVLLIKQNE